MLAFFRRFINSRLGVVVAFVVLALIALGFGLGDIAGVRSGSGALGGASVVKVGGSTVGTAELTRSAQNGLENARQENPALTMDAFIGGGGFESTLERLVNILTLWEFGHDEGLRVGKRMVDGQLASYASLRGPDGKFNQRLYEQLLRDRRLTDAQVRSDIAQTLMAQLLISPTIGATQMPQTLALPYADLLLERRRGAVAFVPNSAVPAGAAPSDAEVQQWYQRNLARYSLPERRIIRYALVTPERMRSAPTDAEIAQSYAAQRNRYQPTEKRSITQVTVLTQSAANALAARVRAGTPLAEAARAAGLESRTLSGLAKAAYAAQASTAAADAVFAAARGTIVGPVRATLGYVVARVDSVEQVPGRSLAQAREEIAATLTEQKTKEKLSQTQDAIGGAVDGNATFSEVVTEQKLTGEVTPAITAQGLDPATGNRLDARFAQVVAAAFAATNDDPPTVVPVGSDGGFAVVALERVVPSAPRPLAEVREQVSRDIATDRQRRAARDVANGIVARAKGATTLAQSAAGSTLRLPAVRPVAAPRAALARDPRGVPPEMALLFSMAPGTAKVVEAPDGSGWRVVKLDAVTRGDARGNRQLIEATKRDIGQLIGSEYAQQFTTAARRAVGVKRDTAAIAQVRRELAGGGSDR